MDNFGKTQLSVATNRRRILSGAAYVVTDKGPVDRTNGRGFIAWSEARGAKLQRNVGLDGSHGHEAAQPRISADRRRAFDPSIVLDPSVARRRRMKPSARGRSEVMRRKVVIALIGLLVATGCRYFAPDRSIRERVDESAVVGTWQLTPASLDLLTRDGFHADRSISYEVSFSPGGACRFASALDLDRPARYVVSECTWSLKHDTTCGSNITTRMHSRYCCCQVGRATV